MAAGEKDVSNFTTGGDDILDEFGADAFNENVGEYNEDDLFGDTEARDVTIPKETTAQQATTSATRHRTTDEEVLDFEDDDPLADYSGDVLDDADAEDSKARSATPPSSSDSDSDNSSSRRKSRRKTNQLPASTCPISDLPTTTQAATTVRPNDHKPVPQRPSSGHIPRQRTFIPRQQNHMQQRLPANFHLQQGARHPLATNRNINGGMLLNRPNTLHPMPIISQMPYHLPPPNVFLNQPPPIISVANHQQAQLNFLMNCQQRNTQLTASAPIMSTAPIIKPSTITSAQSLVANAATSSIDEWKLKTDAFLGLTKSSPAKQQTHHRHSTSRSTSSDRSGSETFHRRRSSSTSNKRKPTQKLSSSLKQRAENTSRHRSRSVTRNLSKKAESQETSAEQEARWRASAAQLGLDGDAYVIKLREQQRVRERMLAEKRRKRQLALGKKPLPVVDVQAQTMINEIPSQRLACVPKSSAMTTSSSALASTKAAQLAHDTLMQQTAPTTLQRPFISENNSITATSNKPGTIVIRPRIQEVHLSQPTTIAKRQIVLPKSSANPMRVTTTTNIAPRKVTLEPDEIASPPTVGASAKTGGVFRVSLRDRLSSPKTAIQRAVDASTTNKRPLSTLSQRIENECKRSVESSTSDGTQPVMRTIRSVEAPMPTDVLSPMTKRARPQPVPQLPPPPQIDDKPQLTEQQQTTTNIPTTPIKLVAEIAAVITQHNPDTTLKKFEMFSKTVGAVKRCVATPTFDKIFIVFVKESDAAEFVRRYNGCSISGHVLNVQLDTYYHQSDNNATQ